MNMAPQSDLYEHTLAAWKSGDDEFLDDALFAFESGDHEYIERVSKSVWALLQRPGLTPRQIVSIGHMLLGLSRLPLRTPGLNVCISLVSKPKGWVLAYSILLNENTFSTGWGGSDNFSLGSDAFDGSLFSVGNHFRQYSGILHDEHWPDVFSKMAAATLKIEDTSEDQNLDWDHPDGSEFWEWIKRR